MPTLFSTCHKRGIFVFVLLSFSLLLTACGGGGGGSAGIDPNADDDGDGFINSADIDDDNDGLIEIATLKQLDWMRNDLAGTSQNDGEGNVDNTGCPVTVTGCNGYELVADLDFDTNGDGAMDTGDTYFDYDGDGQNNGWLPVGRFRFAFSAHFEGNNHRISNLYINREVSDTQTGGSYIGLFGYIDGSSAAAGIEIRNLLLDGMLMEINGANVTGGLVGYAANTVTISNNTASGAVTGADRHTGGLVGYSQNNVTISNSYSTGVIKGAEFTGGLVGYAIDTVTISNSSASGAVTGGTRYTGGLMGGAQYAVTISNSSANGAVTGTDYTGGLVGAAINTTTISNCYSTGVIKGADFTGGLVGRSNFDRNGTTNNINNSFAVGKVDSRSDYIGGLVGLSFKTTITDTFATVKFLSLIGSKYVGGLVGDANTGTAITSSFSSVAVGGASPSVVGGFVGWSDGASYSNNYSYENNSYNAIGTNKSSATNDVNPPGTNSHFIAELKCPISADDTGCAGTTLYSSWDNTLWDFGADNQLPGLIINGTVYRDGNNDGVLD